MYGHLTCPDKFWHVSDTRIGPISNPDECLSGIYFAVHISLSAYSGIL